MIVSVVFREAQQSPVDKSSVTAFHVKQEGRPASENGFSFESLEAGVLVHHAALNGFERFFPWGAVRHMDIKPERKEPRNAPQKVNQ